jgi:hypothetical protein
MEIESCHCIYCLALPSLCWTHRQTDRHHINTPNCFPHSPCSPSTPLHNINTDCHKQDGSWWWGVGERKYVIIWTDSDQTERITQVHLLVDRQKLKWCDMQVWQECVTEHNIQHNTHTHSPVHKSPPQNTQQKTLTSCSHFTLPSNCTQSSSVLISIQSTSHTFSTRATATFSFWPFNLESKNYYSNIYITACHRHKQWTKYKPQPAAQNQLTEQTR